MVPDTIAAFYRKIAYDVPSIADSLSALSDQPSIASRDASRAMSLE
jgi:vacuolar-type H+-ATPase catalytic subunit A/Vma1